MKNKIDNTRAATGHAIPFSSTDPDRYMHHGETLPASDVASIPLAPMPELVKAITDVCAAFGDGMARLGFSGMELMRLKRKFYSDLGVDLCELEAPALVVQVTLDWHQKVLAEIDAYLHPDRNPDLLEQPGHDRQCANCDALPGRCASDCPTRQASEGDSSIPSFACEWCGYTGCDLLVTPTGRYCDSMCEANDDRRLGAKAAGVR
jgi:hypothetical protein